MPQLHEYPVHVDWQGGRDGKGEVAALRSGSRVSLAVPPEFQGTGEGSNPEELLAQAVASCYAITFSIIAANRKLPLASLAVDAVGYVEQQGMSNVYNRIVIRPTVVLDASATDQQVTMAEDMAHKADNYCIVTNAVRGKVEVVVEPTVNRA